MSKEGKKKYVSTKRKPHPNVEEIIEPAPKLELLDDDDIADLGVDLDVGLSSTPGPLNKVACMTCEMVGGYEADEVKKPNGLVFNVMRMQECGHGIVFGVVDARVQEKVDTAARLHNQFQALAASGDSSGAKRKLKKLERAIKNIKIRQQKCWANNRHHIDMPAIPELENAR